MVVVLCENCDIEIWNSITLWRSQVQGAGEVLPCLTNIMDRDKITHRRWSNATYKQAESTMIDIMRANGAHPRKHVLRSVIRDQLESCVGDTGLVSHLLKYSTDRVFSGQRCRRAYNSSRAMEYWLEDAKLLEPTKSGSDEENSCKKPVGAQGRTSLEPFGFQHDDEGAMEYWLEDAKLLHRTKSGSAEENSCKKPVGAQGRTSLEPFGLEHDDEGAMQYWLENARLFQPTKSGSAEENSCKKLVGVQVRTSLEPFGLEHDDGAMQYWLEDARLFQPTKSGSAEENSCKKPVGVQGRTSLEPVGLEHDEEGAMQYWLEDARLFQPTKSGSAEENSCKKPVGVQGRTSLEPLGLEHDDEGPMECWLEDARLLQPTKSGNAEENSCKKPVGAQGRTFLELFGLEHDDEHLELEHDEGLEIYQSREDTSKKSVPAQVSNSLEPFRLEYHEGLEIYQSKENGCKKSLGGQGSTSLEPFGLEHDEGLGIYQSIEDTSKKPVGAQVHTSQEPSRLDYDEGLEIYQSRENGKSVGAQGPTSLEPFRLERDEGLEIYHRRESATESICTSLSPSTVSEINKLKENVASIKSALEDIAIRVIISVEGPGSFPGSMPDNTKVLGTAKEPSSNIFSSSPESASASQRRYVDDSGNREMKGQNMQEAKSQDNPESYTTDSNYLVENLELLTKYTESMQTTFKLLTEVLDFLKEETNESRSPPYSFI